MFMYLSCSLKRRKTANLVIIGINLMLVILLSLYFGSIHSYRAQLTDLSENIPIYCQVTNLNGTLGNELFIPERILDSLQQSAYVKDLSYMNVMLAGEGDFKETEYSKYLNLYVVGANTIEVIGDLTDDMFSMDTEHVNELLSSDRMECIVNDYALKRHGWQIGDKITLKCYYYDPASEFNKIEIHSMGGTVELEITGTMINTAERTNAASTDVIIPAKTAQNIYHKFSLPYFADSVTFHVKDPMNLNAFKADMQEIGLLEVSSEAMDSYTGCALVVRDANFIKSATDLQHIIELMQSFFPIVCILILMIGYVVSYLSGNSRKEEFTLLRLQGVKKVRVSLLFLTEQMILVFIGNLVGDAAVLLTSPTLSSIFFVNIVLLTTYLIGAALAYGQMGRSSVIYLLSAQQ